MLVAGLVLALYAWVFFAAHGTISEALLVSDAAAISAGAAFLGAAILYLWSPRTHIVHAAVGLFIILAIMVVLLLVDTGLSLSPFIALWMLLAVFAPVLGIYGTGIITLGIAAYLGYEFVYDSLTLEDGVVAILTGVLPLVVGYLAWPARINPKRSQEEGRAYKELASELSAISGQSEIVIAVITDGVISINRKGEIQLINPAAQKMIGWGKSDALGLSYKSVLKLVDGRDQPVTEATDPIQKALTTNLETTTDTLRVVTNDSGKKFLAHITASPVGTMGSGLIIVFRDITKERAAEREQAEFISTASHEMRTPVASIEGYLGLALNPATATIDDKARSFIIKAHESAQHLGRLFQDLLDVSKADDGRLSNTPGIIDVVTFVSDIIQGQQQRVSEKGLRINYKLAPVEEAVDRYDVANRVVNPIYYVKVDNNHLREVLDNLIENAIKYTPKGSIDIDVTGDEGAVTISIKDSGVGIPQEDIPHLFQKFYRVDNSDTREIGGTGLGLYLCRRLVETIGGQIWVESTYKQGSTFYVKLPRIDTVTARQEIEKAGELAEAQADIQPTLDDKPLEPTPEPAAPSASAPPTQPAVSNPPVTAPVASPATAPQSPVSAPTPVAVPTPPVPKFTIPPRPTSLGPSAPVFTPPPRSPKAPSPSNTSPSP